MVIVFLRWLFGWTEFEIYDKYPERFLNMVLKSGVNIWDFRTGENMFGAKVRTSHIHYLQGIAQKTSCDMHIIRQCGFGHILKRYKARVGLLAGLVIWGLAFRYATGFVWHIDIDIPPLMNEYEIRQELMECGLYEGARLDTINEEVIKDKISVRDNRISWITINMMGTDAQVRISPNLSLAVPDKQSVFASNIKSIADGTITRMSVRKGTAVVQVGDGISKGQMLVSGIKEFTDGSTEFYDSDAQIYAQTYRSVTLSIPKTFEFAEKSEQSVTKLDINIMGLELPLTLHGNPNGDYFRQSQRQQLSILGNGVPIYFFSEQWQKYQKQPVHLTDKQAENILQNKLCLYEIFMLYSANKATILDKKCTLSQDSQHYILTADYAIEEDIAEKSIIQTQNFHNDDTSNSGT